MKGQTCSQARALLEAQGWRKASAQGWLVSPCGIFCSHTASARELTISLPFRLPL